MMFASKQIVLAAILSAGLMACSLEDGKPWTTVEVNANMAWDQSARIQEDGRFLTSKNYLISFEELQFVFLELLVTSSTVETLSFDPGSPPPGYTLCHQGHCHNEDNQLIPYEEIEADLNVGQSGTVLVQTIEAPIIVDTSETSASYPMELGACSDELGLCQVGPANVTRVGLLLDSVAVKAVIEDIGEDGSEPLTLDVDLKVAASLETQFDFELGADAPEVLRLDVQATLEPNLWDQFEFSELSDIGGGIAKEAFQAQLESVLAKHVSLSISNSK